ncbi:putative SUR7 protein [Seiridium cardinale]
MRTFALLSSVFSLSAFILSLLCLFAGSQPGFLDNGDILTIRFSSAGKDYLLNDISGSNSSLGSEVGSMASAVGISDWYAIHVLNYCRGYDANSTSAATEFCSTNVPFFSFDLSQTIDAQFKDKLNISLGGKDNGVNLSASASSSQIKSIFLKAETAYKVVFFMLCMGIAASGVEIIISLVVVAIDSRKLSHGTMISCINMGLSVVSSFALGLAAGIITGTMVVFVDAINAQNSDLGLEANKGITFLWMIWSSTVLMLVVVCVWLVDYMTERSALRRRALGLETYESGNTLLLDYKRREKILKAERKDLRKAEKRALKQRQAAEHAIIRSERPVTPVRPRRASLPPLPADIVRHQAIQPMDKVCQRYPEECDLDQEAQWLHGRTKVSHTEFI